MTDADAILALSTPARRLVQLKWRLGMWIEFAAFLNKVALERGGFEDIAAFMPQFSKRVMDACPADMPKLEQEAEAAILRNMAERKSREHPPEGSY